MQLIYLNTDKQTTQLFCKAGGCWVLRLRPLILRAVFGYHGVLLSSIAIPR